MALLRLFVRRSDFFTRRMAATICKIPPSLILYIFCPERQTPQKHFFIPTLFYQNENNMKSPVLLLSSLLLSGWTIFTPVTTEIFTENVIVVDFGISKRLMLTEASVEGKKGLFLFDTGASHLTLNQAHFPEKKITSANGTFSNILSNGETTRTTQVATFEWGGIRRQQMLCPIADLTAMEAQLGYPILGLIGYNIVKEYQVHIDYVDQLIMLVASNNETLPLENPDYAFDFQLCGHLPVLEADIGLKQKLYLGLDSGATLNAVDKSWQKQARSLALRQQKIRLAGTSAGSTEADYWVFRQLTLHNRLSIQSPGVAFTDFRAPAGRCIRIDGLIGIDAFAWRKVVIDYPNARLYVWNKAGFSF